jgi:hypothetical protein
MEFIIVSSIVMFALLESRFDGLSEAVYDFIILSALGSLDKNILEQTRRFCERVRIFVFHVRLSDCQIVRLFRKIRSGRNVWMKGGKLDVANR